MTASGVPAVVAVLRRNAVTVVGVLLIVGGLALWWATRVRDLTGFGWYLYEPLRAVPHRYADYEPADPFSPWPRVGLLVAAIGLATTTAGIGYRVGRRAAVRHPPDR